MASCNGTINRILQKLPITNFILSLLIVLHHAFTVDVNYIGTFNPLSYGIVVAIQRLMYNLSECAVPIFYFLSAYLFFRTYDGTWLQYKNKINRRFFSLFIPYIIFCTFGYIKHLLVSNTLITSSGGGYFLIGWLKELWLCQTMPLWFIRELMALCLLAPFFYWLKNRLILSSIIIVLTIIFASIGAVPYRSFVYWIPVYLLGTHMSQICESINSHIKDKKLIVVLMLLYILLCWFLPNSSNDSSITSNFVFILFRVITPFFYLPFMINIANSNTKTYEWMNYSFFVYCMHFPVITILSMIYDKTIMRVADFELLKYILIVTMVYALCVMMAMCLRRFLPVVWNILNGRR
jgi:fucose 4-O-acetylase-like acetyltransferase